MIDAEIHQDRPIRVAHLLYGLQIGGLEQLVLELAARSRDRNVEPLLISFGDDGPIQQTAASRNLPLVYLGNVPGMRLPTLRRVGQTLEDFGADVVHAHDLGPWLNACAARALRPKTQVLATFHQLNPPAGAKRVLAMAGALVSKALVACGNEVRGEIQSWAPPGARVVTIGNGVPVPAERSAQSRAAARARLGLSDDVVAIGYLGRMHEEKGVDRLVEIFLTQFASQPKVRLILIGSGPLESQLRKRTELASNVHWVGEVAQGGADLLQALDIYAQASRREGRSLSMLEAMAAGLPTVAHDLPAISEIHSPRTALLVRPGDSPGFSQALDQLVRNEDLRRRLGEAARLEAKHHSIDTVVGQYAALWRESVAQA